MKIIYDKNLSDKVKDENDKLIKSDEEKWEKGDYGRNKEHMKRAASEDEKKINEMINSSKKKQKLYALKMSEDLVHELKFIASKKHIGYQTLIKIIASEYVEEWKIKYQNQKSS